MDHLFAYSTYLTEHCKHNLYVENRIASKIFHRKSNSGVEPSYCLHSSLMLNRTLIIIISSARFYKKWRWPWRHTNKYRAIENEIIGCRFGKAKKKIFTRYFAKRLSLTRPCAADATASEIQTAVMHRKEKTINP